MFAFATNVDHDQHAHPRILFKKFNRLWIDYINHCKHFYYMLINSSYVTSIYVLLVLFSQTYWRISKTPKQIVFHSVSHKCIKKQRCFISSCFWNLFSFVVIFFLGESIFHFHIHNARRYEMYVDKLSNSNFHSFYTFWTDWLTCQANPHTKCYLIYEIKSLSVVYLSINFSRILTIP